MVDVKNFIKKWHGRTLEDWGSVVSPEYHSFQVSFFNAMRKIAKGIGAEVVKPSYGHYDMSGFIKRGDKYVYFSYSHCGNRTQVLLKDTSLYYGASSPLLIRTAENEKDYHGGSNNYAAFEVCEEMIDKLLNTEHRRCW